MSTRGPFFILRWAQLFRGAVRRSLGWHRGGLAWTIAKGTQPTGLESGQGESGESGSRNHDSELSPYDTVPVATQQDDVTVPVATQQKRRAAEAEEETEEDGQGMAAKTAITRFDLFDATQVKRQRPAQL